MTANHSNAATDIQKLHQNLSEWLNRVCDAIERAGTQIPQNQAEYQTYQRDIRKAAEQVENLELATSIVAPIKAGKSTILNAIAGQDLLPNRAAAMTTIPTEIVFDANITEAKLVLDQEFITIFEETVGKLNQKIQTLGREAIDYEIRDFPYLQDLLARLQDYRSFPNKVEGCDRIRQFLTDINDLIRLCSLTSPQLNLLDRMDKISQIPRIEAPFSYTISPQNQGNEQNYFGKLVLVDTPGPNEAGMSAVSLYQIVKWQLQRSLAVLVVLDFTNLKTQAAENIKQEVQEINQYIGKENLYVFVNKIDARKEGDPMNSESLQKFVQSEFDLPMSGNRQRLFEISGRQAFCAVNFLQEYQRHSSGTPLSEMNQPIVRSVAQEVFGIDWEEELEEATLKQLHRKANRLWEKSGFQPFLEGVIGILVAQAAPKLMNSATNLASNRLQEIQDFCNLNLKTQQSNVEQVKKALQELQSNQELSRTTRDILDELKQKKLPSVRQQLEEVKQKLSYCYHGGRIKQELKEYLLQSNIQLDTRHFSNEREAELEKKRAQRCLRSYQEEVFKNIYKEFDINLKFNIERYVQPELDTISNKIREAQSSIQANLELDLYWQPPALEIDSLHDRSPSLVENLKPKISLWGWMHNVFSFPFQSTFDIPKVNEVYTLKLKNIGDLQQKIQTAIDDLFEQMNNYVDKTLPNSFQEYADKADSVLQSYIDSLEADITSKSQSKEELETIEQSLEVLLAVTEKYLEKAEAFRGQIEEFL